jgi:hypothetical protein
VMTISNFDTAFSGLLRWETTMSADLAPLFGEPVTASFDAEARTANQTRAPFFKDTITANLSTRTLVDETNEPRIVYGFITPTLILIATNEAQFAAVAEQAR